MYKTKPIMDALNALPEDDEKLQEAFKYLRTQDVETQVYVLESFTRTPNKAGGYSDRYTHVFHHLALYWIAPDGEVLDAALVMNKYLEGEEVDAQLLDATSPVSEFTKGGFQTVIGDKGELKAEKVKRVIACSGKVYYDLVKKRAEKGSDDVAIIRVEQLYPFPHKAFGAELKKYPHATEIVWCQDEPQNQGAWFFVQHYIHENMLPGQKLGYAGRPASASPAVGYAHLHQEQQKALLEAAFSRIKGFVLSK